MRFLFRLDLSLHVDTGKKIWNLEVCNQTRAQTFALCSNQKTAKIRTNPDVPWPFWTVRPAHRRPYSEADATGRRPRGGRHVAASVTATAADLGPPRPHPLFLSGSIHIHPSIKRGAIFFSFRAKNSTAQFAGPPPPPPPATTSRRQRSCGAGAPPTAWRRSPSRSSASCRRYRPGRFRTPARGARFAAVISCGVGFRARGCWGR